MHLLQSLFILQLAYRAFGAIDFTQPGPYSFKTITELTIVITQDAQALPTNEYKATARIPDSANSPPPVGLILWSNGFMSRASNYKTILDQAASWGFASAAYDLPFSAANLSLKAELDYIFPAFTSQIINNTTLFNTTTSLPLFSVGYSRGGKVAASIYANPNNTIQACYLIDPVDITPFSPDSPSNPSAVAALALHPSTLLPLGMTAAGITGSCNPYIGNHQTFWNVAGPSSWLGVLLGIAHTAFVDGGGDNALADAFCGGGSSKDTSQVAQLTYVPMLNWLTRSNLLLLESDSSSDGGAAVKEQDEEFRSWVDEQVDQGNMVFEIKEEEDPSPLIRLSPSPSILPTSAALHHYFHHHSFAILSVLVSLACSSL
jgi:hypothetical protein